jgi:hypothetical protein
VWLDLAVADLAGTWANNILASGQGYSWWESNLSLSCLCLNYEKTSVGV